MFLIVSYWFPIIIINLHGRPRKRVVHLREVLQDDARWLEGNVDVRLRVLDPVDDFLDVTGLHVELVTVADGRLEQNSDRVRQGRFIVNKGLHLPSRESPSAGSL